MSVGLDLGHESLIAARIEHDRLRVRRVLNAFISLPDQRAGRALLAHAGIDYESLDGELIAVGDDAALVARRLRCSREARRRAAAAPPRETVGRRGLRPRLEAGLLQAAVRRIAPCQTADTGDFRALPVLELLVNRALGLPHHDGEPCGIAVPARLVELPASKDDSDGRAIVPLWRPDLPLHRRTLCDAVSRAGFTPIALFEGQAVVLSELADDDFTGIGLSLAHEMTHVALALRGRLLLSFSMAETGGAKERVRQALAVLSREMCRRRLAAAGPLSRSSRLPLVVAGPQATEPALEPIQLICAEADLPLTISEVRRAADPELAVVRGCLIYAALAGEPVKAAAA